VSTATPSISFDAGLDLKLADDHDDFRNMFEKFGATPIATLETPISPPLPEPVKNKKDQPP
jgi:hypothetical protein